MSFLKTLKGLVLVDEGANKSSIPDQQTTTFPDKSTPTNTVNVGSAEPMVQQEITVSPDSKIMNKVLATYSKGFEALNIPGFDLFEFYDGIKAAGATDQSGYKMAFAFACSSNPSLTVDYLLQTGEQYITQINQKKDEFKKNGKAKKTQLLTQQKQEQKTLTDDIAKFDKQIAKLEKERDQKRLNLNNIDQKYLTQLNEVSMTIAASDTVSGTITSELRTTLNRINQHLK